MDLLVVITKGICDSQTHIVFYANNIEKYNMLLLSRRSKNKSTQHSD